MPRLKVLILGGTTEGRELAAACAGRFSDGELAGRADRVADHSGR